MEFDTLKQIYDHLQDDASRMIFQKRLEFSLSGELNKLDEMVSLEMKRYGDSDIVNRCITWIRNNNVDKVSVFGAGFAGYQITHTLKRNGIFVEKIYDNNKSRWGDRCDGVTICSPETIHVDEYIVIGVNYYREEILSQLQTAGVDKRHIFVPDALWWLGDRPQYFDERIMKPSASEIFIDGGSLDGGDSKNFVAWCNGKYERIYAFEPDNANVDRMMTAAKEIEKFEVCPVGMWSEKAVLRFTSGASENCAISENGDIAIDVDSIDNVLGGQRASYIKMDIEGSELQALEGAAKTIKAFKPKLAICVYHKPEDIIDIPLKILELNPDYNFYLRHYSYVDTETVLYAI